MRAPQPPPHPPTVVTQLPKCTAPWNTAGTLLCKAFSPDTHATGRYMHHSAHNITRARQRQLRIPAAPGLAAERCPAFHTVIGTWIPNCPHHGTAHAHLPTLSQARTGACSCQQPATHCSQVPGAMPCVSGSRATQLMLTVHSSSCRFPPPPKTTSSAPQSMWSDTHQPQANARLLCTGHRQAATLMPATDGTQGQDSAPAADTRRTCPRNWCAGTLPLTPAQMSARMLWTWAAAAPAGPKVQQDTHSGPPHTHRRPSDKQTRTTLPGAHTCCGLLAEMATQDTHMTVQFRAETEVRCCTTCIM